jgi:uncharacterized membrane protein YdjX (TVP38/TMEM64 family)
MKKGKFRLIVLISIFAVFTVILTVIFWPFIRNMDNPEYRDAFTIWVKSLGFWGIVVLLGVQILQIFIAVIPGGPVQVIAGMAYGTWGGLALLLTGCILSTTIIFFMVRKFGLPLLRRFFGEKDINTWKFLKDTRKIARFVFILFLIPGTPKDLLTWLTPLTNISLPTFVILSTLARIPAILTSTIMGDSMIKGKWIISISLFVGIAAIGLLGMWFKDKLTGRINKTEEEIESDTEYKRQ